MCGRLVIEFTPEMVKKIFVITEIPNWPARSNNISPTQLVPVVRQRSEGTRQILMMSLETQNLTDFLRVF
jgi:putative SOS response-associated peptidase YedK